MLDWAHSLLLRAVADGDQDDSPALRNLLAAGLVERRDDGTHAVTAAGQAALEAGEPSRAERVAWPVLGVCAVILLVATVAQWLT
ncbi:MAG: hypothetical protein H0X64_15625 [Gemmatimonadaceae bacterium]|nr:hypothetical protein [Gemmatimonadaceae bacterium]